MAKTEEEVEENETVTELLRELESMPPGRMLDEFEAIVRTMPKMPKGRTSADSIRELRGPLPECGTTVVVDASAIVDALFGDEAAVARMRGLGLQ